MKLTKARVQVFQNVVDSTDVEIEPEVTCVVGKNEAGKTAFLRALKRLNPAYEHDSKFIPRDDYPRWRWRRDEREGIVAEAQPIWAAFELDTDDIALVEQAFGSGVLRAKELRAWRTYDNELTVQVDVDEEAAVRHLAAQLPDSHFTKPLASPTTTLEELQAALTQDPPPAEAESEPDPEADAAVAAVREQAVGLQSAEGLSRAVAKELAKRLPKFFYFGEYNYLPGRFPLSLLDTPKTQLNEAQRTALSLLELAGGAKEKLTTEDYEQRVAELEASANEITREVLDYWTTNPDIRVDFDVDKKIEPRDGASQPQVVERYLDVRLHDELHQFTTNFSTRSRGFQWLFSFIAAFYEFEDQPEGVVILLDEPALNLHAKAQHDFLRFINERLAVGHQVIYTTHSPFMVEADRLQRVRLVEDKGREGASISDDVLSTDRDTLFPLQGALGYDLTQNLFVGGVNLVVEGTSDFIYVSTLSRHLERLGETHLDLTRWTITPVGGAANVATFVALLGTKLNVTVLVDADAKVNQRLTGMVVKGLLEPRRLITIGQVIGENRADIEDLFTPGEYLKLYNEAYGTDLKVGDLPKDGPIVKRIEEHAGQYDHGVVAEVLLRNPDPHLNGLGESTVKRFAQLFDLANQTIPAEDRV
jgi:energy-coupling factor transporter ATP-binding protein EcfA2